MYTLSKERWSTRTMVKISVMGVLSYILMLFDFPLTWLAPAFIKMDISDLPSIIGAFAMGPMAGVIIQLVKNLLHLFQTSTAGAGELANFVVGSIFSYTAGYIYYKDKSFKKAIIGLVAGTITMTLGITIANYYVMFPLYSKLFGLEMSKIIEMGQVVNKNIVDLKSMMILAIVPFNLFKGTVVSAITILIYKRVSPILKDE